jgi:hypothetical protein
MPPQSKVPPSPRPQEHAFFFGIRFFQGRESPGRLVGLGLQARGFRLQQGAVPGQGGGGGIRLVVLKGVRQQRAQRVHQAREGRRPPTTGWRRCHLAVVVGMLYSLEGPGLVE